MFIVAAVLTGKLCSVSGLNSSLPANLRRRNAIVPGPDLVLHMMTASWQTPASSETFQEQAQGPQNAFVSDGARHISGRSERSINSSDTEHSLWRDPDLENSL